MATSRVMQIAMLNGAAQAFGFVPLQAPTSQQGHAPLASGGMNAGAPRSVDVQPANRHAATFFGAAALAAVAGAAGRTNRRGVAAGVKENRVSRRSVPADACEDGLHRRAAVSVVASGLVASPLVASAEEKLPEVEVPPRINQDPFELLGVNPEDSKQDRKEFYMKRNYREDTYQLVKHMKISGSLDKGTPDMERFQKRIKEEMNDWVALYRRQDSVVGRQSYYSLYSAVNTLASHLVSYGPKFPFPNKRRPRFYQLINQTEKYLEKKK